MKEPKDKAQNESRVDIVEDGITVLDTTVSEEIIRWASGETEK